MATFICLVNFTDQGIQNVKDSPGRYEAFSAMAGERGITVRDLYYTTGRYDAVFIMEGSEEAVTAAMLKVGAAGNIRTETLRGFSVDEMKKILGGSGG